MRRNPRKKCLDKPSIEVGQQNFGSWHPASATRDEAGEAGEPVKPVAQRLRALKLKLKRYGEQAPA
jgi:hypothetical protein